jgi:hypothetical protein
VITGDFAGEGYINVDVSGANEVSDVLYIDGSVVTGTVQTINVDLLDLPDQIETLIPIVYVSGISVDGNFVLGDVDWDDINTFVTLDFDIVSDIDASNATPDIFYLGIEVTGLSDPGTLAASIPGSVQSLMNSQVGTWRQRMGVIDSFNKGSVALWARVFTDKGSFSPEHDAGNFGNGGNFDWDQKNRAWKRASTSRSPTSSAWACWWPVAKPTTTWTTRAWAVLTSTPTPGACTARGSRRTASTWMPATAGWTSRWTCPRWRADGSRG